MKGIIWRESVAGIAGITGINRYNNAAVTFRSPQSKCQDASEEKPKVSRIKSWRTKVFRYVIRGIIIKEYNNNVAATFRLPQRVGRKGQGTR